MLNFKKFPAAVLLGGALLSAVLPSSAAMAAPQTWAPHRPAQVDQAVRQVAAATQTGTVHVLIQRATRDDPTSTVQTHGGQVRHQLSLSNVVAADVPASQLDSLANDPSVVRVAVDPPMHSLASADNTLSDSRLLTAFPDAVGAPTAWSFGDEGTGIGVAVLDSGMVMDRNDFLGTILNPFGGARPGQTRIVKSVAIAQSHKGPAIDDNGHGTWVAGIIGSRGWGAPGQATVSGQYVGIAPNVNIINVKVSDNKGAAQMSDVIAGLEWVMQNKDAYNIKVVNLSLVSSMPESYTTSMLDAAVEMAWFKGITVVVSAGNAGPDTMKYAPANDPFAIVVGAMDDNGTRSTADDQLAPFSSYGTTQDGFVKPDVVAPGRHIVSTLSSPQDPLALEHPANVIDAYHIKLSGTSGAAPVVSGVLADLFQAAHTLNLPLSPDQAKWLLQKTANPVVGAGTGSGYPDLPRAGLMLYSNGRGIAQANQHITPNKYLQAAFQSVNPGTTWTNVSWENVSWENVSWENVSWENVSWENVSWENVSWENVSWENVSWEDVAGD